LIQATRRLYKPDHKKLPLPYIVELNRRLIKGYAQYKDTPLIVDLKKSVLAYNKELMDLQIRDHQVSYARLPRIRALGMLLWRLIVLSAFTLAVLPGLVLFAPVFIAGKLISMKKAKEALAASSVKIEANDVLATWKLLVALGLAPILYLTYACLAVYITHRNHIWGYQPDWLNLKLIFIGSWVVFPVMTFMALRFGENGMDIFKSMRPLLIALSPAHGRMLMELRKRREELVLQVNHAINTLGPELFPDFERIRIIPEDDIPVRPTSRGDDKDFGREVADPVISEPASPASPASPTFRYLNAHGRSDSYANLGAVNVFSSHPATPRRARSRSNSIGGGNAFSGLQGFSPIEKTDGQVESANTSSEELSKRIRGAMRERNARRRSESEKGSIGAWSESGASTPESASREFDGLTMTKKNA
jgi:glycerol-3-phosphate O-acyltransferase / dihydroxyacetone phosphate acyltransferase